MTSQLIWYPGQPNKRSMFDFSSNVLEINHMPPSFIYEDNVFYGNVYSNSDSSISYSIIGLNLVDNFYKSVGGSEDIFTNVVPDAANCIFIPSSENSNVSLLLIDSVYSLVKYTISEGKIVDRIALPITERPISKSPLCSYIFEEKVYIGYISSDKINGHDIFYLNIGEVSDNSFIQSKIITLDIIGDPTHIYVNLGKSFYSVTIYYKDKDVSVIQVGSIANGVIGLINNNIICNGEVICPAFDVTCKYIFFAEVDNGKSTIKYYNLQSMELNKIATIEHYNMLKLAADNNIYGVNGGSIDTHSRFMSTIVLNADLPPNISEQFVTFSGGYFPAEDCLVI